MSASSSRHSTPKSTSPRRFSRSAIRRTTTGKSWSARSLTDRTMENAESLGASVTVSPTRRTRGLQLRGTVHRTPNGELLAFLDADDYSFAEYLEHQVARMTCSKPRVKRGVVACDARIVGPRGFVAGAYLEQLRFGGEVTVATLLRSNPIVVRRSRSVLDEVGGFAEEMQGIEDHDLWLSMVERGYQVVVSRVPLARYGSDDSLESDRWPKAQRNHGRTPLAAREALPSKAAKAARENQRAMVAIERVDSPQGFSSRSVLRTLPLLGLVAVENPRRWPSFAGRWRRGGGA